MKKILFGLFATIAFCGTSMAATEYDAFVSTYAVTNATHIGAQISGSAKIEMFVLSNSTTAVQVFSVYENCASTTTAAKVMEVTVPASSTYKFDFAPTINGNAIPAHTDYCFRKGTASTADDLYLYVKYK
jgi:hypothetical protein